MARGKRRLIRHRQTHTRILRGPIANAGASSPFAARSLAVNVLAATGAAVSVLTPAHAVQLGDIAVESALGQPLSARVPVELGPGELLGAACVTVPNPGKSDLTTLPEPTINVPEAAAPGTYELRVTTTGRLYEPMYELQLQVRCPGTALLVRQYVLMLDLPGGLAAVPAPVPAVTVATTGPSDGRAATAAAEPTRREQTPRARRVSVTRTPIEAGTNYRVARGDTLSTIAARISGRGGTSLWTMADRIFAANPDAFIGANPDLIKLGSEIVIPAPGAAAPNADSSLVTTAANPPSPDSTAAAIAPPVSAPTATAPPASAVAQASVTPPEATITPVPDVSRAATPAPVFQDERPVPVTPGSGTPSTRAEDAGTSPWLATLVGLLVGAALSLVLLRDRLLMALRGLLPRGARRQSAGFAAEVAAPEPPAGPQVFQRVGPPAESTMVVVEEMHEDTINVAVPRVDQTDQNPALSGQSKPYAATGLDSDLSRLFGEGSDPASSVEQPDISVLPSGEDLDLDLSAATPEVTVDQDIGWIGDENGLTQTQEAAAAYGSDGETVEQFDLQTLSEKATIDEQVSQTLKDALSILESDYEEELTASQVVDKGKLRDILDDGDDTMIRTGTDKIPRR